MHGGSSPVEVVSGCIREIISVNKTRNGKEKNKN
jgi:hypothetical protein